MLQKSTAFRSLIRPAILRTSRQKRKLRVRHYLDPKSNGPMQPIRTLFWNVPCFGFYFDLHVDLRNTFTARSTEVPVESLPRGSLISRTSAQIRKESPSRRRFQIALLLTLTLDYNIPFPFPTRTGLTDFPFPRPPHVSSYRHHRMAS